MPSASKVLTLLLLPSSIAALAVVAGLILVGLGRKQVGFTLAVIGAALIVGAGLLPVGNWLMLPLEQRFAASPAPKPGEPVSGIIVLGGFEDRAGSSRPERLGLNEAGERLTEGLRLALRFPAAELVISGGVRGDPENDKAAGAVAKFLTEAGIAPDRLVLETRSQNTYENAAFTKALVKPEPGQRWLLVTSAYHMPRAMGLFRKAGFDVTAYPVDFRTRGAGDMARFFDSVPAGLERTDTALREWAGLFATWLAGKSAELFPAP